MANINHLTAIVTLMLLVDHHTCKNIVFEITYDMSSGTLNLTHINHWPQWVMTLTSSSPVLRWLWPSVLYWWHLMIIIRVSLRY